MRCTTPATVCLVMLLSHVLPSSLAWLLIKVEDLLCISLDSELEAQGFFVPVEVVSEDQRC
ncbi:hypothetical protein NC653_024838 [Populus alba x Populus x berolinensis]|uniref:Uncharacterized protein n=1 Tax=Populus alba x Populus x berolinensis TaxID=444605 RepID=A0AAD6Q974_9ROSI|nr:hypothetical protein NC653_024838 [Populus alba x Populus x berolinensis]